MSLLLGLLDNASVQGLTYGVAVLGLTVAFRVIRFPDLTADGSFVLGASAFAAAALRNLPWAVALGCAVLAGAICGLTTTLVHQRLRVGPLLSGILTTMVAYSIAFRVMGRSNLGLLSVATPYTWLSSWDDVDAWRALQVRPGTLVVSGFYAILMAAATAWLLRSQLGLLLRAAGSNPDLVEELGRRPTIYQGIGLVFANAVVALSAALLASRQGFADVNMGVGVTISLLASLVLGEELLRLLRVDPARHLAGRVVAAFAGAFVYFLMYLVILRASIQGWLPVNVQPTDLKLLSAVVVAISFFIRLRYARAGEEPLPV